MASKARTTKPKVSKQVIIWLAAAIVLLLANALMLGSMLFGNVESALSNSKRAEFDLVYDNEGNATPQNLLGNPLKMVEAELMAEEAMRNATQHPDEPEEETTAPHEAPHEPPHPAEEMTQEHEPVDAPELDGHETEHTPTSHLSDEAEFTPTELPDAEPVDANPASTTHGAETPPVGTPPVHEPAPAVAQQHPAATHTEPTSAAAPPPASTPKDSSLSPVERRTAEGIVPVIAADGTKPWQYFAKQDFDTSNEKPRIAIVISGLGLAALSTQDAIDLPSSVTLSFSPYGREAAASLAMNARAAGHEIMLDLPMQTERFPAVDPGPYGIRNDLSAEENSKRLAAILGKARGYVGLLGTVRDVVSNDTALIVPLIEKIAGHGLLYVAGHTQAPAGMFRVQRTAGVPILMTDIVIDDRITDSHIRNQLARAEDLARTHGEALVVGHSYPITVDLLAEWIGTLQNKGFNVVPVSAMGKK